ncbi:hypothetical protein [Alcanivorax sp. 1008]|uniref:hypothetical protein n=1 Tax=Alcanivorax sp. 1008 TaxID=2816853 RepID=UPI001DAD509E|nr:hypothetical protein [Alcanivorax sp. 1008]MCC1496762.1 hypothetical protein [Alcanivorax sp. 1008]
MEADILKLIRSLLDESKQLADDVRALDPRRCWLYTANEAPVKTTIHWVLQDFRYRDDRTPEQRAMLGPHKNPRIERYPGICAVDPETMARVERINTTKKRLQDDIQGYRAELSVKTGEKLLSGLNLKRDPALQMMLGDAGLTRVNLMKMYRHLPAFVEPVKSVNYQRVLSTPHVKTLTSEQLIALIDARIAKLRNDGTSRRAMLEARERVLDEPDVHYAKVRTVAPQLRANVAIGRGGRDNTKVVQAAMPIFVLGDVLPTHNGATLPTPLLPEDQQAMEAELGERTRVRNQKILEDVEFIKDLGIHRYIEGRSTRAIFPKDEDENDIVPGMRI